MGMTEEEIQAEWWCQLRTGVNQMHIRRTRQAFSERRKLPLDNRTNPEFFLDPKWMRFIPVIDRNLKEMMLKQDFMSGLDYFWEEQGAEDYTEGSLPPEVQYERIVIRMQRHMAKWFVRLKKELKIPDIREFPIQYPDLRINKEARSQFENEMPTIRQLRADEAFMMERALPFTYGEQFLMGKGPLEQMWMTAQAKKRHREMRYNLQAEIDRVVKFCRTKGILILRLFMSKIQGQRQLWFERLRKWKSGEWDIQRHLLDIGVTLPAEDNFIPIVYEDLYNTLPSVMTQEKRKEKGKAGSSSTAQKKKAAPIIGRMQRNAIAERIAEMRNSRKLQEIRGHKQTELMTKELIERKLGDYPVEMYLDLTDAQQQAVRMFLNEQREMYVVVAMQTDKENLDFCSSEGLFYEPAHQQEMMVFINALWLDFLGENLTPTRVEEIIKELQFDLLINDDEDEADRLINEYTSEPPPQEEESSQQQEENANPEITPRAASPKSTGVETQAAKRKRKGKQVETSSPPPELELHDSEGDDSLSEQQLTDKRRRTVRSDSEGEEEILPLDYLSKTPTEPVQVTPQLKELALKNINEDPPLELLRSLDPATLKTLAEIVQEQRKAESAKEQLKDLKSNPLTGMDIPQGSNAAADPQERAQPDEQMNEQGNIEPEGQNEEENFENEQGQQGEEAQPEVPVPEPVPEADAQLDDEPVGNEAEEERPQESTGSASIRPTEFFTASTPRGRTGIKSKYPRVDPVEGDQEDLQKRFNGQVRNAERYKKLSGLIIPDKGFEATQLNHHCLNFWKHTHGWDQFLKHDGGEGYVELTREFSVNIDASNKSTWVRGTRIDLSAEYLNNFCGTPNHIAELKSDEILKERQPTARSSFLNLVSTSLCSTPPSKFTFKTKLMKVEFQHTYDFYCAKIRPNSHPQETSGSLLSGFAQLWAGKKMNVGEHIVELINRRVERGQALCYPNLIRRICDDHGVDMGQFAEGLIVELDPPFPLSPDTWNEDLTYTIPLEQATSAQSSRAPRSRPGPQPSGSQAKRAPSRAARGKAKVTKTSGQPAEQEQDPIMPPPPPRAPATPQIDIPQQSQGSQQISQPFSHEILDTLKVMKEASQNSMSVQETLAQGMADMFTFLVKEQALNREERKEERLAREKADKENREALLKMEQGRKEDQAEMRRLIATLAAKIPDSTSTAQASQAGTSTAPVSQPDAATGDQEDADPPPAGAE